MQIDQSVESPRPSDRTAIELVLREAKRLHRAAVSDSLAESLPILRRLIAGKTFVGSSLPDLSQRRRLVRRKHVLRTLAIEAGYPSWEEYRKALATMEPEALQHFDIVKREAGYPNHWFSCPEEADAHVAQHGGRMIRVGRQAVVIA